MQVTPYTRCMRLRVTLNVCDAIHTFCLQDPIKVYFGSKESSCSPYSLYKKVIQSKGLVTSFPAANIKAFTPFSLSAPNHIVYSIDVQSLTLVSLYSDIQ